MKMLKDDRISVTFSTGQRMIMTFRNIMSSSAHLVNNIDQILKTLDLNGLSQTVYLSIFQCKNITYQMTLP